MAAKARHLPIESGAEFFLKRTSSEHPLRAALEGGALLQTVQDRRVDALDHDAGHVSLYHGEGQTAIPLTL